MLFADKKYVVIVPPINALDPRLLGFIRRWRGGGNRTSVSPLRVSAFIVRAESSHGLCCDFVGSSRP